MAKLTFVLEDGQEIEVPLEERITLGRADDNDVVVDDERISKRHAELVINADGSVQLFDSNSTAGTFVNGERVQSRIIHHGDRLAFGPLAAVLDLNNNGTNGNGPEEAPVENSKPMSASPNPVKAGRIGSRKKNRGARRDFPSDAQTALPAEELLARQQAEQRKAVASLANEEKKLQDDVESLSRQKAEQQRVIVALETEKSHLQDEIKALIQRQDEQRSAAAASEAEKSRLQEEVKNLVLQQAKHKEAASALEGRRAQLQSEFDKAQKEWVEWQKRSEDERNLHSTRLESLRAEEARLGPVQAAVHEAEKAHVAWIQSITALSAQHEERTAALAQITARHDEKSADLQRLAEDENSARQDLKDLATQREQTLAHLRQMREEQAHDETVLDELRRQIAELEAHSRHCKEIAEVRNDQVDAAEKKLDQLSQSRTQIQAHIQELTGTEEKLVLTLERCREAEKRQAALTTALAELDSKRQQSEEAAKELESRVAALKHSREEASAAADKAQTSRRQSEASLLNVQTDLAAREKDLATRIAELNAETKRLKETQERHAEIERQCQELAETGKKLAEEKQRLATAGQKLDEVNASIAEGKTRIASLQSSIKDLEGEEGASKGRIDVLHAREKDLRAELTRLSAAERKERVRFEEVRQLTVEAEKEHAEQKQELASSLATQGRELAELVSKLTPLRDWKEAMDLLYARLATLPQDSSEARDLWREIEREKNGLHDLITTARSQALVGSPPEPRNEPECEPQQNAPTKANRPPEPPRATTARVGIGSVQETTLRARLTHLRENVQREEAHLEHLRLERARQEIHPRSGPASDAMMREHERQLEAKIRRDEEHYTAIKHKIGLAETEEEKRREKITELEHKLAELRADISEAERLRHELRQQADLAHTELKNYEAALVRVTKKTTG